MAGEVLALVFVAGVALGVVLGSCCRCRAPTTTMTATTTATTMTPESTPECPTPTPWTRDVPCEVIIAPHAGVKFHLSKTCKGLDNSLVTKVSSGLRLVFRGEWRAVLIWCNCEGWKEDEKGGGKGGGREEEEEEDKRPALLTIRRASRHGGGYQPCKLCLRKLK